MGWKPNMRRSKTSLIVVAVVGALVTAGATASPAVGAEQKKRIPRTEPSWVAHTKSVGKAPAANKSTFRVYLAPNGGLAALKADVAKVSDPASSSYRQFISAQQYHAKYDATAASAAKVSSWLAENKLKVTSTEAHRRYLEVAGTNAAVEKAFSTTMRRFHHAGQTVAANTSAVAVPADIAPLITTVTGLDTTPHRVHHNAPPPAGFRNGTALLDVLRTGQGHQPGRLQDAAAEVQGQDAALRSLRLRRLRSTASAYEPTTRL